MKEDSLKAQMTLVHRIMQAYQNTRRHCWYIPDLNKKSMRRHQETYSFFTSHLNEELEAVQFPHSSDG